MEDEVIEIKQEQEEKDDDAEKQQQRQPPRKVTKVRGGQKRDYIFLQSVKSVDELDNLRFKNYCILGQCKKLPTFKSRTMPCTRKCCYKPGKECDFELLAVRQEDGTIDVYAHSEHNHPFMSEEKRTSIRHAKELMPAVNPPRIYQTPDNIECTYLRTFPDYAQMQKFRFKSHCRPRGKESRQRIRFPCNRIRSKSKCEFTLLALKTIFASYHVYTFGEHNHPAIEPTKKQQEMDVDEDDEEEENETDEDNEEENDSEEDDDIIMIEDEDDIMELEQPQQEEKRQGPKGKTTAETPENAATPRVETAKEKLAKANANIYKWMAGIEPTQIGPTLGDWDNSSLLRMVEMANQELRQHPAKFDLWRPWLKVAMKKCMQMENFGSKYKDLIILMFDHVQD